MNFMTHIKMATMFSSQFSSIDEFRMSSFIWGNVKPDITLTGLKHPHIKKYTYLKFMDDVERLPTLLNQPHKFSRVLGEIVHHLCDYFCYAHRDENRFYQLKWHFDYEIELERHIEIIQGIEQEFFKSVVMSRHDDIFECIHEMDIYYDQFPHSIEKDIAFTFSMVHQFSIMLTHSMSTIEEVYHEHSSIH
jgi:hypothetical protein